ncbi:sigma-70 family RNA polymerase sigma factor [Halioglobus maricola]|nr:sigma-70 family RNA polymerase sigma factor [Halioglobus maricola]
MSAIPAGHQRGPMAEAKTTKYGADEARWAGLMTSAQRGEEADYRRLLTELAVVIDRYLRSRLGAYDLVEDCVQDSLLAIHQARHTYDPRRPFRPWLFAIVRHKAVDALRRGESKQRLHLVGEEIPEQAVAGPESELQRGQLLDQLPQTLREALVLTKILGLSTGEAAARIGISQAALKVRVHRAMRKVKNLLESDLV